MRASAEVESARSPVLAFVRRRRRVAIDEAVVREVSGGGRGHRIVQSGG